MLPEFHISFSEGFLLGAGLIIGIGPQNTFVLHQSLHRQHLLLIVSLCTLIDAGLIVLGSVGVGSFLQGDTLALPLTYATVAFLLIYGLRSFKSALFPLAGLTTTSTFLTRKRVVIMLLIVSLSNPAAYLDTMLVIGVSARGYGSDVRFWFISGAISASLVWFASLSYGSARFARLFEGARTMRLLNLLSGSLLCFMALRLLPV